jgi:hypothetical protein
MTRVELISLMAAIIYGSANGGPRLDQAELDDFEGAAGRACSLWYAVQDSLEERGELLATDES